MNAGARLALYAAGLAVAFAAAFGVAGAVVPDRVVAERSEQVEKPAHGGEHGPAAKTASGLRGLSQASNGLTISPVTAPDRTDRAGTLSFTIEDAAGEPVVDFAESHEKDMHLIVVRSDGSRFRHVHPTLDTATGVWSVPWTWEAAGTYRVFADFVPTPDEAPSITLARTVDVAGTVTPQAPDRTTRTAEVDGFDVTVAGDLKAGSSSQLDLTVERDGEPVTSLQPYLGAFGHLVALRQGDLGFLHVHAEGEEPQDGDTAGPTISFMAEAPTAGRYLLYLDFQVDGTVRTAPFVLDAHPKGGHGTDHADEEH